MATALGARDRLAREISKVVSADLCSGCGGCAAISSRVQMRLIGGYQRPIVVGAPTANDRVEARAFRDACPGRIVRAQHDAGAVRHPYFGPVRGAWAAWATDDAIRWKGSSGGTLTALAAYLAEVENKTSVGASASSSNPSRSVSVRITTREEALASAGSRYAPCSPAELAGTGDPGATIGKPCEASMLRQWRGSGDETPIIMSFFCAGTPSQNATDGLVRGFGMTPENGLKELWYRGRGWPGRFTAIDTEGREGSLSYDESWGAALGPSVQWRCRLCPDGVGEAADVTAGDFWHGSESGVPDFTETAGRSVLIARTARGLELVERAIAAGYIEIEPINLDEVLTVQPYHFARRKYMLGRIIGQHLSGGRAQKMKGFGLIWLARKSPVRILHEIRGTWQRRKKWITRDRSH